MKFIQWLLGTWCAGIGEVVEHEGSEGEQGEALRVVLSRS
jgi:hypothetical protein